MVVAGTASATQESMAFIVKLFYQPISLLNQGFKFLDAEIKPSKIQDGIQNVEAFFQLLSTCKWKIFIVYNYSKTVENLSYVFGNRKSNAIYDHKHFGQ